MILLEHYFIIEILKPQMILLEHYFIIEILKPVFSIDSDRILFHNKILKPVALIMCLLYKFHFDPLNTFIFHKCPLVP